MRTRNDAHDLIARNIRDYGCHIYVVSGGPTPRWVYTIGLTQSIGYELVFAGGAKYSKDDILQILRNAADKVDLDKRIMSKESSDIGAFALAAVHPDWATRLLLGAHDFYQTSINALQIVPDPAMRTIDVPDLSTPLALDQATPWRWLEEPWPYSISEKSEAMTDLKVLMGGRVTEVARWEEQYWEAFSDSGDEVSRDDAFLVPLGTLLGADQSLAAIMELHIGAAMWRGEDGNWQAWT